MTLLHQELLTDGCVKRNIRDNFKKNKNKKKHSGWFLHLET